MAKTFTNPFRPGAGHMPPFLAGRGKEIAEFTRLLEQDVILENLILTGLRGVGKTVLLDTLKPIAIKSGWLWVGTEFHEAASITEERIATRLLSDLAVVTSNVSIQTAGKKQIGFANVPVTTKLDHKLLDATRRGTPGMVVDGLKNVLELVWSCIKQLNFRGVIFAYDEAQNLADHAARNEFPLSTMLDCFQSIQKKNIPMMLVLAGLPMLFPKLVESRTFAERMFHILKLDRLSNSDAREAITKPIADAKCPVHLTPEPLVEASGGYPYFIQFLCKEAYDSYLQQAEAGVDQPNVYIESVVRKLDTDFFSGRWAKATDRQRELMHAIARTEHAGFEFTVREVADATKKYLDKPISPSQVSQMFGKLSELSLVYKNRKGKYAFAVPLMHKFILRQESERDG